VCNKLSSGNSNWCPLAETDVRNDLVLLSYSVFLIAPFVAYLVGLDSLAGLDYRDNQVKEDRSSAQQGTPGMSDFSITPLRIWHALPGNPARGVLSSNVEVPEISHTLVPLAQQLGNLELLRSPGTRLELPEILSLQWYLEIERLRYHRQGKWLPSLLEFGKHQGERLLGLGTTLGTDLIQYARHGAEVFYVSSSTDHLSLIRRNFALRGLEGVFFHSSPLTLPIESASIDVLYVQSLLDELDNPSGVIDEIYRVLKPGGKVLCLVPACFDIDYWARLFYLDGPDRPGCLFPGSQRFHRRQLLTLFGRFIEARVCKRHLRRSDVPHLWRWLPLSLLERLAGRLLIYKGFKPLSAARTEQAAA